MNHTPQVVAAVFVGLAVIGAGIIQYYPSSNQRHAPGPPRGFMDLREPRLLSQKICGENSPCGVQGPPNFDVHAVFALQEPRRWREGPPGATPVEYFVSGTDGRMVRLVQWMAAAGYSTLGLLRGYGRSPKSPAIVAIRSGVTIARLPIQSLPDEPRVLARPSKEDPRIRLYWQDFRTPNGLAGFLRVALRRKIDPLETTSIEVKGTSYRKPDPSRPEISQGFVFGGAQDGVLWLPNGENSDAAALTVRTFHFQPQAERVTLKGARLSYVMGRPVFRVDRRLSAKTPRGLEITIPEQNATPSRPLRHPTLAADLIVLCLSNGHAYMPFQPGGPMGNQYRLLVVSPKPSELGLESIRTGSGPGLPPEKPKGPVKVGPVTLTIEVQYSTVSSVSTFDTVVPIPPAPKGMTRPFGLRDDSDRHGGFGGPG